MRPILNKTYSMKLIELNRREPIEETLRRLYVDENLSHHDMAKELGISYVSVGKWLNKAGIYSRKLNIS